MSDDGLNLESGVVQSTPSQNQTTQSDDMNLESGATPISVKGAGGSAASHEMDTPPIKAKDVGQGFAANAAEGLLGGAQVANKIPGVSWVSDKIGDALHLPKPQVQNGETQLDHVRNVLQPQIDQAKATPGGKVGSMVENLSEFLFPERPKVELQPKLVKKL